MSVNNKRKKNLPVDAHDRLIEHRREEVARMHKRRMTLREIAAGLAQKGFINPDTNAPYSHVTVKKDLDALMAEWRENAQADLLTLRAAQQAELQEVKRAAWAKTDLGTILRAMEREARLLGLDMPMKIDINMTLYERVLELTNLLNEMGVPADKHEELFARLIAAAKMRVESKEKAPS
ncbi:MAG: hypothetical protein CUN56_12135 [Phototrophicales bacterium]|nr:MAG: hypothetical protein CUN56_12135 [Phototrophicales bacterium]